MTNSKQPTWLPSHQTPAFRQETTQQQLLSRVQPYQADFQLFGSQPAHSRANQVLRQQPEFHSSSQFQAQRVVQQPTNTFNYNNHLQRGKTMTDFNFDELVSFNSDGYEPTLEEALFAQDASPLFSAGGSFDSAGSGYLTTPIEPVHDSFISPAQLSKNSSFCATGSSQWTNLTTPDLDVATLSPFEASEALTGSCAGRYMGSLFPETQQQQPSVEPAAGTSGSRPTLGHRHSSSAGVIKATKRRKGGPLKDIVIPEDDKVAAKRARNTLAARDSRKRKEETVQHLEGTIRQQEEEIARLQAILNAHNLSF